MRPCDPAAAVTTARPSRLRAAANPTRLWPAWAALPLLLMPGPALGAPAPDAAPPNLRDTVQVLVAYHSLTTNTHQMAEAVVDGIRQTPGATATLKPVEDVSKTDLDQADAIILGCPTYYANIPGRMKIVLDDWSWKLNVDFTDKVGGAFATGGGQTGGKEHVVVSLLLFMLSNRMVVAGPLYRNDRTGSIWGEPGSAAMTGPLDPGVGPGELDSARRLGERVANLARKLKTPRAQNPASP